MVDEEIKVVDVDTINSSLRKLRNINVTLNIAGTTITYSNPTIGYFEGIKVFIFKHSEVNIYQKIKETGEMCSSVTVSLENTGSNTDIFLWPVAKIQLKARVAIWNLVFEVYSYLHIYDNWSRYT